MPMNELTLPSLKLLSKLKCLSPVLVSLAVVSCGPMKDPSLPASAEKRAPTVTVQKARLGDVSQVVTVTGSLVALEDVSLSAKQSGRLTEVLVREGDTVKVGQVLARVDDTDLRSQLRSSEAAVTSAGAKLEQAQAAYAQQLAQTDASIDSAQAALNQQTATSAAQVRSAESKLASAKAALSTVLEGARPEERKQTEAALASAEASCRKAESDLRRYKKLHDAGAISDAEYDKYVNSRDVALADLNSKRAALRLQQEGNRRQDIQQARETVKQAEEALQQANAARATDEVKKADLRTAIAARRQNNVKLADIDAAKASLQEAISAVAIAQQALGDAVVRSPIAGRVSERTAEPGQVISSATTLLHVVSLNTVFFEPAVAGSDLASIKVGQPVSLRVDTYPDQTFLGSVTKIYPQSSSETRTTSLRVTLPNSDGKLRPNMFAQGTIIVQTHRSITIVPIAAVITKADKQQVLVVEGGIAHVRNVAIGLSTDKGLSIEVRGLSPGASVITSGQDGVEDGQKVQAAEQTAGSNQGDK